MSDGISETLVDEVVRRVLDALGPRVPAAPAKPAALAADGADRPAAEGRAAAAPARVWVTAEMLADRAGAARPVSLAMNEHLTPAARDYAAARGVEVVRGNPPPPMPPITVLAAGRVHPAVLTRTLGLVVHRPDAKVESALGAVTRAGVATAGFADSQCWMVNAQAMCDGIRAGQLAGGVILDRYAAAPMALAGKIRGVRPVQGVSAGAVAAGLRQFDANVLVIGHATVTVYEIRSMVDRFAAGRRMGRDRTALLDAVEQLEREGQTCELPG